MLVASYTVTYTVYGHGVHETQLLQAQHDAEGRSVRFPCVVLLDPTQCSKEDVDLELEEAIGRTLGRVSVTSPHTLCDPRYRQRHHVADNLVADHFTTR
jgi:hypothetical protein